jgi:hypothetical protein
VLLVGRRRRRDREVGLVGRPGLRAEQVGGDLDVDRAARRRLRDRGGPGHGDAELIGGPHLHGLLHHRLEHRRLVRCLV